MCTVVSRRDGRIAFVKRENVRFLGSTLLETKRKKKRKKRKILTDDKENDSPTCSDVPPSKKWKPWISERVWAKWRGNARSRSKTYYGATVQEKYKNTYSIQYDDGSWDDNIRLSQLQIMKPEEACQYTVSCGAGHSMTAFKTDRTRKCSACSKRIPRNKIGYECATCGQHKCQKCCAISNKRCYDSKIKTMKQSLPTKISNKRCYAPKIKTTPKIPIKAAATPLRVLFQDNVWTTINTTIYIYHCYKKSNKKQHQQQHPQYFPPFAEQFTPQHLHSFLWPIVIHIP